MATDEGRKLPSTPWGELPPSMRVLFVTGTGRTGGWLAEAFASDNACDVVLVEAVGIAAGLAQLRDEIFDAVLIGHESQQLDALGLLDAIRAGSSDDQPVIVLGQQSEQELAVLCYEAGADAYLCVNSTTTRMLLWHLARAMERQQLIATNRRYQQDQRHRLQLEHDEAGRLLRQQRKLISELEQIQSDGSATEDHPAAHDQPLAQHPCPDLPAALMDHYRELLRAYVIMGSGNLSAEMTHLTEMLASAGVSASQAMLLHLHVLEEMVRDLGSRSARHVMSRADLLILEMIINLAEGYRTRLDQNVIPPRQLSLPGFAA